MDVPQQILEVATRLMAARGYDATSLSAIADEVGVRKATLLYHFASKETLRLAVLDRLLEHWSEALPRILLAAAGTGSARFEALTEELVEFFSADRDRARLLLREMLDRPEAMRDYLTRVVKPWIGLIADQVKLGQRSGEIRADVDPESYVLNVVGLALVNLSTADALGVLLAPEAGADGERAAHQQRYVDELVRMARSSLFSPAPGAADQPSGERRPEADPSSNAETALESR